MRTLAKRALSSLALVSLVCVALPPPARAESGRVNLHLELGYGLPLLSYRGPPSDDGSSRNGPALWWSVDLPIQQTPWAFEAIAGLGYMFEHAQDARTSGDTYWNLGVGVRRRILDDHAGYLDDQPGGNWLGNLWVSSHLGYHFVDDVQFGLDLAAGYELSLRRPFQVGGFIRTMLLFGGRRSEVDPVLFFGLNVSFDPGEEQRGGPFDADGDGIPDDRERAIGTDPSSRDTDGDGIADDLEVRTGTSPTQRDSDSDGLPDGEEDDDLDGQVDVRESDPRRADTDGGGVHDGDERYEHMDPTNARDDDSDGDGVLEPHDECPETERGEEVLANGCPRVPDRIALPGITFRSGSATIERSSEPALQRALQILTESPDMRVEIAGHTDDTGRAAANVRLSRRRAEAVRRWLIRHGIARDRLTAQGYGSGEPAVEGTSEEARAQNRRIELRRLPPAAE